MIRKNLLVLPTILASSVGLATTQAAVVEYWNFEDGTPGAPFTDTSGGAAGGSGGSASNNGTLMHAWDNNNVSWTDVTSPNGGSYAADADGNDDGYVFEGALPTWTSSDWTLEMHVFIDNNPSGWLTFVGRDGSNFTVPESDFYFQRRGDSINELRLNYRTSGGTQYIVDGTTTLQLGQWYGIAAVADSTAGTLTLFVDDGSGYAQNGQLAATGDLGVYNSGNAYNWTFGRGWYNGAFGDFMDGQFDNVRFSDTALAPSEMIALVPEPSSSVMLLAGAGALALRRRRA